MPSARHRWCALALAAGLVVAGCSSAPTSSPSSTRGSSSGAPSSGEQDPGKASATPSAEPSKDSQTVAKARHLAAQYDYDAALKLLAGEKSEQATAAAAEVTAAKQKAVVWKDNGTISHIFFHSLIVDPARAFAPSNPTAKGYAEYMVTQKEFEAQLKQIYAKGYVLINPGRLVAPDANGVLKYQPVALPPGKKPLVVSVDDVSYYEYMEGHGFASKLIVTPEGTVTNVYTDAQGVTKQGAYDVPTVVDAFVRKHPDFSYRGDKGTIALTGYDGVLGYRTSVRGYGDNAKTRAEQKEAKVVADALKADGWVFASHTWGHINIWKTSPASVEWDTKMWQSEVAPIVGSTDLFIFPFGVDGYGSTRMSAAGGKYPMLKKAGFTLFFPIDSTVPSWTQLQPDLWRQMRIGIDGSSMAWAMSNPKNVLYEFFDTPSVIDASRPK